MSEGTVLRWLIQFAEQHLPLAERILQAITYFSATSIRAMTRELVTMIINDFGGDPRRIHFCPDGRSSGRRFGDYSPCRP